MSLQYVVPLLPVAITVKRELSSLGRSICGKRIAGDCYGVFDVFFGDVKCSVLGTLVRDFAVEKKTAINANEVGE